jgi:hypothetical protein
MPLRLMLALPGPSLSLQRELTTYKNIAVSDEITELAGIGLGIGLAVQGLSTDYPRDCRRAS